MSSTDKNEDIAVPSDQQSSIAPISDPSEFHEHSHSCNDPTHNHNFPSFVEQNDLLSSLAATKSEAPVKRKQKKNKQQNTIRAETIPGHRGNESIDDLLNFINGPSSTNDKKQKKKSTTTTNN